MVKRTIHIENTARAYLELLGERGIDYFFANAGTDFAPLLDAFAFRGAGSGKVPKPVTVPHENAAAAMAHGYYVMTGKPQVVMVHVNVGTANVLNGIINAARDNVPTLFTAGRTPVTEAGLHGSRDLYIHWSQESFDQAAMVREYVKWDYELRCFDQLESVVDRALEVAMAEPKGPVYLTLPREVLAERRDSFTISTPGRSPAGRIYPDPRTVEAAARILASARNPLVITSTLGRNREAVGELVKFAEEFAVPVVTFNPRYMSFPTNHPMHMGFNSNPLVRSADAILVIDSDVPWYPDAAEPSAGCKVIHMGTDPFHTRYPMRNFPCDVAVHADPVVAIPLLAGELGERLNGSDGAVRERFRRIGNDHAEQRASWREALEKVRADSPLDPLWISHCINAVKDDETIVLNEYDLAYPQVEFTVPGTFFGSTAAGGLGWGLGAALGVKLAAPERTVITAVGDGSYMFGNPTPCHFVSRAMDLPTLTVIFNNRMWNAVRLANLRLYPDGWASQADRFPLSELEPSPDYEKVVTASGGYGEKVEEARDVLPALERALKAVREEGRQAVLNMICKKPE